jgi:hypothetical protein
MGQDGPVSTPVTDERPAIAADAVLAAAVDLARSAVEQESTAAHVGDYRGCFSVAEQDPSAPVAIHLFQCTAPAYVGWGWSVAVTRLYDDERVTVNEVVLQPGEGALLPQPWVPWNERLLAGDLGVGDLLPTAPDDERLAPAYTGTGDPVLDDVAGQLGLGRVRVLSRFGRVDAAQRWHDGPTGPQSPMARQAPGPCGTCGFYLPLEGSLRGMVGACGNEYSPTDGRVVTVEYGCGGHSEAANEPEPEALTAVSYDTQDYDVLEPSEPELPEQSEPDVLEPSEPEVVEPAGPDALDLSAPEVLEASEADALREF